MGITLTIEIFGLGRWPQLYFFFSS